jgi:hypothetical protein
MIETGKDDIIIKVGPLNDYFPICKPKCHDLGPDLFQFHLDQSPG